MRTPTLLRHGFTIIELMVVLAVIGLLIALLMPQLARAKEIARMTQCLNNLHNNGIAIRQYGYDRKEAYPDFFYSFEPGNNQGNTVVILYKPKKAASTGWTYLDPSCMVCSDDEEPGAVHVLQNDGTIVDMPCSYDVNVDFLVRDHLQDQTNNPSSLALMFDGDIGHGGKQGAYLGTEDFMVSAFLPRHISSNTASVTSGTGSKTITTIVSGKRYGGTLWADGHATMETTLPLDAFIMQGDTPWVHGNAGGNGGGGSGGNP